MNDIINNIFNKFQDYNNSKNNRDYINAIASLEEDKLIVDKYYVDDKFAYFDLVEDKYNYRIYIDYTDCGIYLLEIRKKLSEIYKSYGIHWEISYVINDFRIITIEEREKLDKCNERDISCDELLLNWKSTLDVLSEKLDLKSILSQISEKITTYRRIEAKNLILIRDKLVVASDYAISKEGKIILLEDMNFVFCITNYKGNIISFKGLRVDVETTCGKKTFNIVGTTFNDKITHIYEVQEKFFLYDYSSNEEYFNDTVNNFDEMIQAQIDTYMDKGDVEAKYQREYMMMYLNKIKKDGKYVIEDSNLGGLFFDRNGEKRLY